MRWSLPSAGLVVVLMLAAVCRCASEESTSPGATCDPNPCAQPNRNVCAVGPSGPVCSCNPGTFDDGQGDCLAEQCLPACDTGEHCLLGSCVDNTCPTPCPGGEMCVDAAADLCQCGAGPSCAQTEECTSGTCVSLCANGKDDDGDDWLDAADPDCTTGGAELGFGATQCNDGIDNDNDGWTDWHDPQCSNALDDHEST